MAENIGHNERLSGPGTDWHGQLHGRWASRELLIRSESDYENAITACSILRNGQINNDQ